MNQYVWILLIVLPTLSRCTSKEQQERLNQKIKEVNLKEQQLQAKEQEWQAKDIELNRLRKVVDSLTTLHQQDSLDVLPAQWQGSWVVKMECTQTSCPGSAVGDTKTEVWDITAQDKTVTAKATKDKQPIRQYAGYFMNNTLFLLFDNTQTDPTAAVRMQVSLQQTGAKKLQGQRDLTQADGCRITYSLSLDKQ